MNEIDLWTPLLAFGGWLYHWQTLVGAILALLAAWRTIVVMRRQMKAEDDRHKEADKRKRMVARARMPDALSDLLAYVRGCAAYSVRTSTILPEEPVAAVAVLKEVIEHIDDDAAARTFELVSWYQVYRVRMTPDIPHPQTPQFAERMYDTALLHAYANSLYGYARNETNEVDTSEPTVEELVSNLKQAVTPVHYVQHEQVYQSVLTIIERRHEPAAAAT